MPKIISNGKSILILFTILPRIINNIPISKFNLKNLKNMTDKIIESPIKCKIPK